MTKLSTCIWVTDGAEAAAQFYVALLPGSEITRRHRTSPDAPAILVEFTLAGRPFSTLQGMQGGVPGMAVSIVVETDDQTETDRLWTAHLKAGGSEVACGWLTDRYGVAWQIIPRGVDTLLFGGDAAANARVFAAMESMKKLDIAALRRARNGETK